MENIILTSCFWLFLFIIYKYSKPRKRLIQREDIFSKDVLNVLNELKKFNSDIKLHSKELDEVTSKK